MTDAQPSASLLPGGLQEGIEAGGLVEDKGNESNDWEMVAVVEEFVMVTAIEGAEGLNPSFDEVRKRTDWP